MATGGVDNPPAALHFWTLSFAMSILLGLLTFILIVVSLFLVLVVLAQKSKDGGMGAALGGGAAEATFGAETSNVLSKSTIYAAIIFFVLAFVLYLGRIYERKHGNVGGDALPNIAAPALPPVTSSPAPATGTPASASAPAVNVPVTNAPAATSAPVSASPATPEPAKKP